MMIFLLHCLFFVLSTRTGPAQNVSYIDWNASRKLSWNDFNANPPKNPPAAALTSTAIKIDFGYYNESLQFHIRCRFDKEASWGFVKNDYVLSHEQGHFDITEIYARKLNAALKKYVPDPASLRSDVNKIYQDMMKQYYDRQDEYDHQTNFSIDHAQQEVWLNKIRDELSELKGDANYR
jgi:Bacterial protein of unknown function (DUF922)